eukprot:s366_g44.t1
MAHLMATAYFTSFHSCAYGGKRYKATSFLTSDVGFLVLCRQCDGLHEHLSWGFDEQAQQFSTALEAEYPKPLCEEYGRIFLTIVEQRNLPFSEYPDADDKLHPQKQHRGRAVPPLIPEYARVVSILLSEEPKLDGKNCLAQELTNIPTGSKLLRTEAKGGTGDKHFTMYVFGIFHGHKFFLQLSRALWHPFDELRHIPDLMIQAIFFMLSHSRVEVARRRLEILQEWRSWAKELGDEEQRWRATMPEHVRMVLHNKRPALLQKLATEVLDWPDREICNDLCKGFRIVGEAPATGIFRTQPKPAVLSESELMEQCKFLRPAIIGKTRASAGNDNASELYDITLKEATEKQWLCGPLTYEQVNALFGQSWLPVRRFGVEQRSKLRPIDDFCENRLNSTFTTVDKISLRTMDHITWAALIICKHCLHTGDMKFVLSSGECLAGGAHDDWKGNCELKVTALDLKSAYKQLPLHEADVPKAVVTIWDPECNQTRYFTMRTLPFGAAASVLRFNRISKLLWALGCKLGLIWASYYDDYPMLCPAMLESSSLSGAKALFNFLGFQYAGDKLFEPSHKADILGVELDLALSCQGVVDIRNKQERIHDICQTLDNILESRRLKPRDLPSHLGRLQFADMQIAGRAGKLAMHDLRKMGSSGALEVSLEPSQVSALKLLKRRIESGKPRRLQAKPQTKPWILFTDGSLEYDDSGAAMSPEGVSRYFGCEVPAEVLKSWQVNGREHVIGIIELYACVVALAEWQPLLKSQRTILFFDN